MPLPAPARLTTAQQVRDRLGSDAGALGQEVLDAIIAEQQALVEGVARRRFTPADDGYALARAATTNLAAAMAMVRLRAEVTGSAEFRLGKLDVGKRTQLQAWARCIEELRLTAQEALRILERDARARRFTTINGVDG
jgi:hypothetical protein